VSIKNILIEEFKRILILAALAIGDAILVVGIMFGIWIVEFSQDY